MKKAVKILYIVLCVLMILSPIIFANGIGGTSIKVEPNTSNTGFDNAGNRIVGIIKVIGVFVSVGALMAIGIKYMMGSAEEKAEYKKVMIPYIIGAVLLFAASLFADKIADFAQSVFAADTPKQ